MAVIYADKDTSGGAADDDDRVVCHNFKKIIDCGLGKMPKLGIKTDEILSGRRRALSDTTLFPK